MKAAWWHPLASAGGLFLAGVVERTFKYLEDLAAAAAQQQLQVAQQESYNAMLRLLEASLR